MKFLKTKNISKSSNLEFNHTTKIGYSYKWYQIVKEIKGLMVINNYNYSPTTIKHYHKIDKLISMKYKNIVYLESPQGLQDLNSSVELYTSRIAKLEEELKNPRNRPMKNLQRQQLIELYKGKLDLIKSLQ